mgnify:CR=1 FL=1
MRYRHVRFEQLGSVCIVTIVDSLFLDRSLISELCEEFLSLVDELRPLLVELTGPVVLRRLVEIPELAACGLTSIAEEP